MLKITTYDNGNRTVLELDGKLVGPWVNELERVWHQAKLAGAVYMVLKELGFIDESGKELLARISHSGAALIAVDSLTKAVLHDVLKGEWGAATKDMSVGRGTLQETGKGKSACNT